MFNFLTFKKSIIIPSLYLLILSQTIIILFLIIFSYFSRQSFIITSYFNFPTARAASSWIQTDWTGGSGQDSWSDATKYSVVAGEGVYNGTDLRMKVNADVVIGQPDFISRIANNGGIGASTLKNPYGVFVDGSRFFVADINNHRVLIYNTIPTFNNASADVAIGQADFISNSINRGAGTPTANTLNLPTAVLVVNNKLLIADGNNNRVLIYNSIPTASDASADVVIGQVDFTHGLLNQGGTVAANTLYYPFALYSDGTKLFIVDRFNSRVLIYNTIPTSNNASADVVIGQPDFISNIENQNGSTRANTFYRVDGISGDGTKLFVADNGNHRVLVFNTIPTSNNASADVVIGQPDFISNSRDQGGTITANTLGGPQCLYYDGAKLFVPDWYSNRMLIYSTIPTSNNAPADIVIGQPNLISGGINQGSTPAAYSLYFPNSSSGDGDTLIVGESENHRVLIYNLTPVSTTLTSSLYDDGSEQEWGPVAWTADTPVNTSITVEISTDSGITWTAVTNGQGGGKSQTMRYRVTLNSSDGISTPTFSDISINYSASINPAPFTLSSPEDNISIRDNSKPTFSWQASSDSESGVAKYQLYIDGVLDTDNIPNTTTSVTPTGSLSFNTHTWYVKAIDYAGNSTFSNAFTLNLTITPGVGAGSGASSDATFPVISDISSSFITANTAIISWNTNELSNSQVEYGLSSSYGFKSSLFPNSIKYHVINLTNLSSTIVYHYRVISIDTGGNKAVSGDYTFTTLAGGDPALNSIPTPNSSYPDSTLLKTSDSPKVYVIIQGKKKWISTPEVFETLGYKWTNITITDQSVLSAITDYEDNLIRANGDYKVWLVTNGIRHHVPNPEIFLDYGFAWTDVKDVPQATIDQYRLARLIRESKQDKIYYLSVIGIKKWIPTADIFNSYNNKWEDIQVISKKEMDSYPVSNLMSYDGKIYLISGTTKRLIPNETILKRYDVSLVLEANQAEWGWFKLEASVR